MCRVLRISRSGYYDSLKRQPSQRDIRNAELLREVVTIHEKYPSLGLDPILAMLRSRDFKCSRNRLHRLMKKENIHSIRRKAYKTTTNSDHSYTIAPNLLKRDFSASAPSRKWVGDITYINTSEGWLYLAIVKDLFSREIVGYSCSRSLTSDLAVSALEMAVRRRKPGNDLIFHSDRGIQYASYAYRQALQKHGILQSMSRRGDPHDNAVAENFFSCFKCELAHLRSFATRSEAELAVFSYIEAFYNTVRPHSSLGWLTPKEFMMRYARAVGAV